LPEQQKTVQQKWRWRPDEAFYRLFLARDEQARLVSAVIFVTEVTIHGPVRVAVGIGPDGRVKGAAVVALSEETYRWVKPLIEQDVTRDYVGQDTRGTFAVSDRLAKTLDSMSRFYGAVIANLIRQGAILYEIGAADVRSGS
jgi:hypothetical protein